MRNKTTFVIALIMGILALFFAINETGILSPLNDIINQVSDLYCNDKSDCRLSHPKFWECGACSSCASIKASNAINHPKFNEEYNNNYDPKITTVNLYWQEFCPFKYPPTDCLACGPTYTYDIPKD